MYTYVYLYNRPKIFLKILFIASSSAAIFSMLYMDWFVYNIEWEQLNWKEMKVGIYGMKKVRWFCIYQNDDDDDQHKN